MKKLPDAVFILDTKKEHIGVTEARKLGIPIVAVVDTNCDPDLIQYVIPGNDDAIRAGTLMCRIIADAVEEGRIIAGRRGKAAPVATGSAPAPAPAERSADEEARIAAEQAEARREAARQAAEREARIAASKAETVDAPAAEPATDDAPDAGDVADGAVATQTSAPADETPVVETPVAETQTDTNPETTEES
jgi:small subunit ribosomal protein S2